jgi:hypothetical protein
MTFTELEELYLSAKSVKDANESPQYAVPRPCDDGYETILIDLTK